MSLEPNGLTMDICSYGKSVGVTVAAAFIRSGGDPEAALARLAELIPTDFDCDPLSAVIACELPVQAIREAMAIASDTMEASDE